MKEKDVPDCHRDPMHSLYDVILWNGINYLLLLLTNIYIHIFIYIYIDMVT